MDMSHLLGESADEAVKAEKNRRKPIRWRYPNSLVSDEGAAEIFWTNTSERVPGNCVHYSDEEQRGESRTRMYSYCDWEGLRLPCARTYPARGVLINHFYLVHVFLRDIVFSKSEPYSRTIARVVREDEPQP
ncbi:hypothetical protein M513_09457 [Trichuris suis]|uniref:Uncharacterized protein n=1 Tax=Trichuris suis TaxID=68888 RepID=A0A085LXC9_9BILA|nr:hypothetical protein M513_09457 [Trichuris suis]